MGFGHAEQPTLCETHSPTTIVTVRTSAEIRRINRQSGPVLNAFELLLVLQLRWLPTTHDARAWMAGYTENSKKDDKEGGNYIIAKMRADGTA